MRRASSLLIACLAVALLTASCSGAQTIDLEPTTGIAATCEWTPDENGRRSQDDDRWGSGADALIFVTPAISAGAIITPADDGFDESPPVAAGDVAVVLALLEEAQTVARVEVQSRDDAFRSYTEMFDDSPLIGDVLGPDDMPLRISVWADPGGESDLPFRSLMWALDARPDVFGVFQRVELCLSGFLRDAISCSLSIGGPVDIVLFVGLDRSLASVAEIAGEVGSGSIEVVDSEATLFEISRLLDIDVIDGRLSTGDMPPSVRISNIGDPDAVIDELNRRFDQGYGPFPPTIARPGQGCD